MLRYWCITQLSLATRTNISYLKSGIVIRYFTNIFIFPIKQCLVILAILAVGYWSIKFIVFTCNCYNYFFKVTIQMVFAEFSVVWDYGFILPVEYLLQCFFTVMHLFFRLPCHPHHWWGGYALSLRARSVQGAGGQGDGVLCGNGQEEWWTGHQSGR